MLAGGEPTEGKGDGDVGSLAAGKDAMPACGLPSCAATGTKRCTACKAMYYCSQAHQRSHWKVHKVGCRGSKAKRASVKGGEGGGGRTYPEGKDAEERGSGAAGGACPAAQKLYDDDMRDDAGAPEERTTRARHEMLRGRMEDFGIQTALIFALGGNYAPYDDNAVKLALSAPGLDVNMRLKEGRTVLWGQCSVGRSRNVALLLADARVDPNLAESTNEATPLYAAASQGADRCVEVLLADLRVNVNQGDSDGDGPLYIAADHGRVRCLELLLADPRVNVNQVGSNFSSPTVRVSASLVSLSMGTSAPCTMSTRPCWGSTPLYTAAKMGRDRCVELLVANPHVIVDLVDSYGHSPLYIAANMGEDGCVALLLADPRVDVNLAGSDGATPLYTAANQGRDRCVELLLADPRVDVNPRVDGTSLLCTAVNRGSVRCVELLLADPRGDVNQANWEGISPLHAAANLGRFLCLELLLADERIDVCRTNTAGETPLAHACFQLRNSIGQVGAPDSINPARCFVRILQSRRVTDQCLRDTIAGWKPFVPTDQCCCERLSPEQQTAQLVIPVLEAQLAGERRWCAYCLTLTPDKDIDLCSQCHQVGYCRPLNKMQLRRMPHEEQERRRKVHCQTLHWHAEGGHKKDCKRRRRRRRRRRKKRRRKRKTRRRGVGIMVRPEGAGGTVRR